MATGKRRSITPMMRSITAERLGAALDLNTRGPSQNKRIAQLLGCSADFAGDLKRGIGWTPHRIDQCIQHFGAVFVQMVFGEVMGPVRPYEPDPEIVALRHRMARLEARVGGDDEFVAPGAGTARRDPEGGLEAAGGDRADQGRDVGSAALAVARMERAR